MKENLMFLRVAVIFVLVVLGLKLTQTANAQENIYNNTSGSDKVQLLYVTPESKRSSSRSRGSGGPLSIKAMIREQEALAKQETSASNQKKNSIAFRPFNFNLGLTGNGRPTSKRGAAAALTKKRQSRAAEAKKFNEARSKKRKELIAKTTASKKETASKYQSQYQRLNSTSRVNNKAVQNKTTSAPRRSSYVSKSAPSSVPSKVFTRY